MSTSHSITDMHKKFEINKTNIKGSCQSGRKVVTHNSMSDLPLDFGRHEVKRILFNEKTLTTQILEQPYILQSCLSII